MKALQLFSLFLASAWITPAAQPDDIRAGRFTFPIYRNVDAGKQVGGVRAAAANAPLPAKQAQAKFTLPPGFEARLFATEPAVVNPVAMTWDTRGRLWVLELYEYPLGAKPGEKPRDRIKILEDTDADGVADKVHVWADGLNLATGLLLGDGGAYVGAAPNLLFLKDTDGDDIADHRAPVMTGFGTEDRHELLNGFTWGPDGYLYMTHGVFTRSRVKDPSNPGLPYVYMDAAIARFHPRTRKFEVFADGTSNPWGVDFDYAGNAFISACVIDHMWHIAPGALYQRQGGTWPNAYAYADMHSRRGGLPSIVDHRHHLAAYCGIQIYQGDQYPQENLGTALCGNIHDNAVHQDLLTPNGSSFKSSEKRDFIRANDGWFRPVMQKVGPDGAVWIADWYDKYPCYQNARADPEGVDREYGRIWRVVYTGKEKGKPVRSRPSRDLNLETLPSAKLFQLIAHPNVWQRREAQRLLTERRDASTKKPLELLALRGGDTITRLQALWTLHACGFLDDTVLATLATDNAFELRTWTARLLGERATGRDQDVELLEDLANDPHPSVRLAVATAARQYVSSHLTVNRPAPTKADTGEVLNRLVRSSKDGKDPLIPFLIWMAAEPLVAANPGEVVNWLELNGAATMPLAGHLTHKTTRRLCDLADTSGLDQAVTFVASLGNDSPLTLHALRGIAAGMKGRSERPTLDTGKLFTRLLKHADREVRAIAQRLGTSWGNASAAEETIALITDSSAGNAARVDAIRAAAHLKNRSARTALQQVIAGDSADAVRIEAIRALSSFRSNEFPDILLKRWSTFSPPIRIAATEVLSQNSRWAAAMASALENGQITRDDVSVTTIRSLLRKDWDFGMLARRYEQAFGRVRDADKNKARLIAAKKKYILSRKTQPDLERGAELARLVCFTCHKLHDEGTPLEVGPNLTGAGRSSLDALLNNILDPNQVIGAGYEMTEIVTADGQSFSGRVIENSPKRVRLLAAGPREEIIAKTNIRTTKTSEISLMPEGLAEQMSDTDFRDLVAYILNHPGDGRPFSWKNHTGGH